MTALVIFCFVLSFLVCGCSSAKPDLNRQAVDGYKEQLDVYTVDGFTKVTPSNSPALDITRKFVADFEAANDKKGCIDLYEKKFNEIGMNLTMGNENSADVQLLKSGWSLYHNYDIDGTERVLLGEVFGYKQMSVNGNVVDCYLSKGVPKDMLGVSYGSNVVLFPERIGVQALYETQHSSQWAKTKDINVFYHQVLNSVLQHELQHQSDKDLVGINKGSMMTNGLMELRAMLAAIVKSDAPIYSAELLAQKSDPMYDKTPYGLAYGLLGVLIPDGKIGIGGIQANAGSLLETTNHLKEAYIETGDMKVSLEKCLSAK